VAMLTKFQPNLLNKQQYLETNRSNFVGLTKKQKDDRYQLYRQKYLNKDRADLVGMTTKNRQIIPYQVSNPRKPNNGNQNINMTKARKATNRSTNMGGNSNLKFKLSKCLLSYARASIDPFDNITELPCIPDVITVPAYRFRTYLEADVEVGGEGVGWAVMSPWKMIMYQNGSTGTSSDFPVVTTHNTYGSGEYIWDPTDIGGGTVIGWNPQSQMSFADINPVTNPGVSWRLVAAGMELDYTGVLLDQAGLVTVIQWDGLNTIPLGTTIPVLRQHPRSQSCATSREARCYIRYEPTNTDNYSYQTEPFYYPAGRTTYYPLGIFVSGATPGTTFRIRAVAFFEIQSSTLPAVPSEADPVGFPAFQAARSSHLPTPDPQSDLFSILKKTASNILTSISGFAPVIGTAIGSMFGQPAVGGVIGGVSKDLIQSLFGA